MTVVNKAGFSKEFDFTTLAAPEPMQRSLAAAFARASRGWTQHSTALAYWSTLLAFVRFLEHRKPIPRDLDDLDVATMRRWRQINIASSHGKGILARLRVLLLQDARMRTGPAAEEVSRRVPGPRSEQQSFDEAERKQVLLAAQREFRTARIRIRENTELLERWRAGHLIEGSEDWRIGRTLDHLARTGDVPHSVTPGGHRVLWNRRLLRSAAAGPVWNRLFLTNREATALGVLLTGRFGWNLSVLNHMPAPTTAPSAGETKAITYQVQIQKRRAGRGHWFSTENITDSGADSPGRLITQALEATLHGRVLAAELAPGTDLLITFRTFKTMREDKKMDRPRPVGPLRFGISDQSAGSWGRSLGLRGSPFQRVRRSTVVEEGRPLQHSQRTHQSVYVLPDRRVQAASREIFEEGATAALEKARATVFGGQLSDIPDPEHLETATADCADENTSPWPHSDGGCGAEFMLCLACRNAHVHPGHHARLAHLHQQLASMQSVLPEQHWNDRWHDHLLRLEDLRDKVGHSTWHAALAKVNDTDRMLVDLLLKGDLTP
ncbi:hypothetical protein ABT095_32150 [Kitasatospora sp. NPDC002227]|uniref:hypothetical protein n=1 Tax=Kitasatospora sp. NPDC002227 TaxID=3154773 RepID=UPI00331D1EDB